MEVTSKFVDVIAAEDQEDEVALPGFRFHPTDEELVGFYLWRKVEKKPIAIEIIKQIDIYKYDPWDLPKVSNVGEKDWYFFCKRGRKYRNSIRPNRVTGSGFWKATGIDKPIFSTLKSPNNQDCIIGLKKSLVYYRGTAGKGTKTDWMMHEFRLPFNTNHNNSQSPCTPQDAEIWTLCRIFRRIPSFRKYIPTTTTNNNVKDDNNNNNNNPIISLTSQNPNNSNIIFTSKPNNFFQSQPFPALIDLETKPKPSENLNIFAQKNTFFNPNLTLPHASSFEPSSLYPSSFWNGVNDGGGGGGRGRGGGDDVFTDGGWDELRPVVVQFASINPSSQLYGCVYKRS